MPDLAALLAVALLAVTPPGAAATDSDPGLAAFTQWLDRVHPGYGCDEGPARFRNDAVSAAYGDRRFYYVLTHARGIQPPFENSLSLVAHVDDEGGVHPLSLSSLDTFQAGLPPVTSARGARRAAAAVLMLSMADPGGARWPVTEETVAAERHRGRWVARYAHGSEMYVSTVTFDRKGRLSQVAIQAPPVP